MVEVTTRAPAGREAKGGPPSATSDAEGSGRPRNAGSAAGGRRRLFVPMAVTLAVVVLAAFAVWLLWTTYMGAPWTRDGTVRVYVVTVAPEVSGNVVELPVRDNQFVHKGDLLMRIDPRNYHAAFDQYQAALDAAQADFQNKQSEAARRDQLTDLATTPEIKEQYNSSARMAEAEVERQKANLELAKVNLERTEIRSGVNGWVTNLLTQKGDYANTGQTSLTLVDADSFWVDGYFEETMVGPIREGDPARVWLLGYRQVIRGHVDSLARGIEVPNAQPDRSGLASVNPVFTWVRLAQRVPVRVHIDAVPPDVRLVAGMTATVEIDPRPPGDRPAVRLEPESVGRPPPPEAAPPSPPASTP